MKVLILGSSGFIGRNLTEQLPYQLLTPSRKELNLLDKKSVLRYRKKYDVVINCVNCKQNYKAFLNILLLKAKKIINLGSGAEYNKSKHIKNIQEGYFTSIPIDDYGFNKFKITSKSLEYDNIYTLHLFGVFGKYEDYNRRFISKAILDNLGGYDIKIYQDVKFSYIWVNDLVKIIDWFINNKPEYQFYNIGGHQLTLTQIAKKIALLNTKRIVTERYVNVNILRKGMANEYTCNDLRLRKETGIKYTPFNRSLKELRGYYETIFVC